MMVMGGARLTSIGLLAAALLAVLAASAVAEVGVPVDGATTTDGGVAPLDPGVPEVPGVDDDAPRIETPPPEPSSPAPGFVLPEGLPIILIVVLVSATVIYTYAPAGVQRMRIETAWRMSNQGRLMLAKGEFRIALDDFDRAIEEAHAAYTRRDGGKGPVEWRLRPDAFYVGLWRGRAAALRGMGRRRAAEFTETMASELETAVAPA